MNFKDVKNINIPEGCVVKITSKGVVLWMKKGVEPDVPDNPELPNGNEIWYKTIDGNIITPTSLPTDNTLISNTYKNGKGVMTFENNITEIDDNMFYRNNTLLSIVIPDGVTLISGFEFYNCTSLKEITISNSVTSIGNNTFNGCISLNKITSLNPIAPTLSYNVFFELPEVGTLRVPENATGYNVWLENLPSGWSIQYIVPDVPDNPDIPDNPDLPTPLANEIYYTSTDGKIVELNWIYADVQPISNTYENGIGKMVFENDLTEIGRDIFYNRTTLYSINIPNSVTSLNFACFSECSNLTSINIPNSVTKLESNIFYKCSSLQSIVIPDSVTYIGSSIFFKCTSLQSVTIPNSLTRIPSSVFENCTSLPSINIPDDVTNIEDFAFIQCSSLQNIEIPKGVTTIGNRVFENCTLLTTIICKPLVAPTIGNNIFTNIGKDGESEKILYVPQGSTGYETWLEQLEGWKIEYITE